MADALTVQSYYERQLNANGITYDIIPIPVTTKVTPTTTMTTFYTYEFESSIDICILFLNHFIVNNDVICNTIQYIPLAIVPTSLNDGGYYTPSVNPSTQTYTNHRRMWIVRDGNKLNWYTCGNGTTYTGTNLTIGDVVALVTYA